MPTAAVGKKFEQIGAALLNLQGEIMQENQDLTALRDFLHPMLINGQIQIKSAP